MQARCMKPKCTLLLLYELFKIIFTIPMHRLGRGNTTKNCVLLLSYILFHYRTPITQDYILNIHVGYPKLCEYIFYLTVVSLQYYFVFVTTYICLLLYIYTKQTYTDWELSPSVKQCFVGQLITIKPSLFFVKKSSLSIRFRRYWLQLNIDNLT